MTFVPGTDQTVSPGGVLASARKAAGLSVADVAAQMRITPRQVEALEADRYAELPGAVFVRGFVRNYARVLKLEPTPLLHALEPALAEEAPLRVRATSGALPLSARRDRARPLLIVFFALVALVFAGGGYELWRRQQEQAAPPGAAEAGTATAPAPVPAEKLQQPERTVLSQTDAPAPAAQELPAAIEGSGAPPAPDAAPAVPPQGAGLARLRVEFAADSWLEVRDREGAVLFSGTSRAGSERVFEANAPLAVVIGNASGVRITYNDRAVDLAPYAARNIARLTLE